MHDQNRPQPPRVEPGEQVGDAPSDAVILFDGSLESFEQNWVHTKEPEKRKGQWLVVDGVMQCTPGAGYIATREEFGDVQLHIEWAAPTPIKGSGQGRGNSGVFLMGMTEVQVLDNYENPTYADGTAGAVYGVMPPAANALRAPGEWQSYDIIFRRPIVRDGVVLSEGSMTVLCNGVVIQDSTPLDGGGGYRFRKPFDRVFPDLGRLSLQDHGNPVRYRNIWVRSLRPTSHEGASDGRLTPDASIAKRTELAAEVREDAAGKQGVEKALRLLESIVYAPDVETLNEADAIALDYLKRFEGAALEQVESEKWTTKELAKAYAYLSEYELISADHSLPAQTKAIVERYGWGDKKK